MTRYQKRLSGPILDRFDIHLTVSRVEFDKLTSSESGETSDTVRRRVTSARHRQWARFGEHPAVRCNAEMRVPDVRAFCGLERDAAAMIRTAVEQMGLSARAYHRALRVSRTIADLVGSESIEPGHVAEAIQYQPRGRFR